MTPSDQPLTAQLEQFMKTCESLGGGVFRSLTCDYVVVCPTGVWVVPPAGPHEHAPNRLDVPSYLFRHIPGFTLTFERTVSDAADLEELRALVFRDTPKLSFDQCQVIADVLSEAATKGER